MEQEENLGEAVELTLKNLEGLKKFADSLHAKLSNPEATEEQKKHLVYFCNAINDGISVVITYNNNLSGNPSPGKNELE